LRNVTRLAIVQSHAQSLKKSGKEAGKAFYPLKVKLYKISVFSGK
jgi:hypothetical protein